MSALSFDDVPAGDAAAQTPPAPPPPQQNGGPNYMLGDNPYLPIIGRDENSEAAASQFTKRTGVPATPDTIVSPDGAIGQYQVTPATARQYGLDPNQLVDPAYNKLAANVILNALQRKYGDDPQAIAVAYESGPGMADRWIAAGRNDSVLGPIARSYLARTRGQTEASPATNQPAPGGQSGPLTFNDVSAPLSFNDVPAAKPVPGQHPVGPQQKPESSWWDVLKPNIATAWDRLKQVAAGAVNAMAEMPAESMPGALIRTFGGGQQAPVAPESAQGAANAAKVSKWASGVYADAATDIRQNMPELDPGSAKDYAYQAAAGVTQLLPILAVTAITKDPEAGAAMMGGTAFAQKYAEARSEGRTPDHARLDALYTGTVNGALGALPLGVLMKPGGSFLAQTLRSAGSMGAFNVVTEALQIGYDKGLVNPRMTLKNAWGRLEQAGIVGVLQGGLLGAGHAGLESAIGRLHAETPDQQAQPAAAPAEAPPTPGRPQPQPQAAILAQVGLAKPGEAPAPAAAAMPSPKVAERPVGQDVAYTQTGRAVPVRYAVVDAHALVPSQTQEGMANPLYPQELQPRDRTRAVSQNQIAQIAQNLNPRLLDKSAQASDGAPIVSPDGIVESGNGRTLAIQRAYAANMPSAADYRAYLESQGYPTEGMQAPMLVRVREQDMAPAERQAFVREANQSGQLRYSAAEQANVDAAQLPTDSLDLYRGGDVDSAANRDFVRSFLRNAVPESEHGQMLDRYGQLSQDAVRRVRNALFAKAYGDPTLLSAITESPDNNVKSIGAALGDVAPEWARMRAKAAAGEIPPELDQTSKLMDAAHLVALARQEGRNVAEYVAQPDIFSGEAIDPDVESWLRLMFRNSKDFTQPVAREKLADALRYYAQEAQKVQTGPGLFGAEPTSPEQIRGAAKGRQYGTGQAGFAEASPLSHGEGVRPPGAGGAGQLAEGAESERGASAEAPGGSRPSALGAESFVAATPGQETNLTDEVHTFVNLLGPSSPEETLAHLGSYVRARGLRFNQETLAGRARDGTVLASTDARARNVGFGADILKRLDDPAERLVTFHNHPSSSSFSIGDLQSLSWPGHAYMVVTAHDGNWYAARLSDALRAQYDKDRIATAVGHAAKKVSDLVYHHLHPLFRRGELDDTGAGHLHSEILARVMQHAGFIDYMSTRDVPERFAGLIKEAANAAGDEVVKSGLFRSRPAAAENPYRHAEPVRLRDGIARILERIGESSGGPREGAGETSGARLPARPTYRKPEQLRLLERRPFGRRGLSEDEDRYKTEPGAVDAQGRPLPQTLIPGTERSAKQLAAAREMAGKGMKTSKTAQKEAGPLFGAGEGVPKQGTLFEDPNEYQDEGLDARALIDRQIQPIAEAATDLVHDFRMMVSPMAEGSAESRATAKDFANLMRLARWHGNRMMAGLRKTFTHQQLRKMWEAADEESVARQEGKATEGIGLSTLTPEERQAVLSQQADAQSVWDAAKQAGMVQGDSLPSYVPRMVVEMGTAGAKHIGSEARSIPGLGRNIRTRTAQLLHRGHLRTAETEAAASERLGRSVQVVKDIRTLPLAVMRLREALAGRALINQIKTIGRRTGEETVVEGSEPTHTPYKWFTLEHPAFRTWRPAFSKNDLTGKWEARRDENGQPVFEKVPIYVRSDFEGPLRAIMSEPSGKIYGALMNLKAKAMTTIMYSPLIHNGVEWGRALPAMPGKVASLRIYFEGNAAKHDPKTMTEAIMHGLVPIGSRAMGDQDITSMASADSIKAGRSWTAKAVGAIPGLFSRGARDQVYRAIDAAGDFWHNTLLWDRVADLQMGLYTNLRDHLVKKGLAPDSAQWMAAHLANRYAGALPREAMSAAAQKIANLLMFSRTYTLGNLGAMKDVLTGLPLDVQAKIEQTGGMQELQKARSMAKRKALSILVTDMALFYAGNSLLQSGISVLTGQETAQQAFVDDYLRRLNGVLHTISNNPLELLNPFGDILALTPQSENETDRDTGEPIQRILVGYDKDGTAIYARNPTGKIGEEFKGWLTKPFSMVKSKLSPLAHATYETMTNDAGYGRHVYDPNGNIAQKIGSIVAEYMGSQVPLDSLKSAYRIARGKAQTIDYYKTAGPLVGVTFRKGAPGGPAVGELYELRRQQEAKRASAMPGIIEKIKNGDIAGARADMHALGLSPYLANYYVRATLNPRTRLTTRSAQKLIRQAPPEERARIQQLKGTEQ